LAKKGGQKPPSQKKQGKRKSGKPGDPRSWKKYRFRRIENGQKKKPRSGRESGGANTPQRHAALFRGLKIWTWYGGRVGHGEVHEGATAEVVLTMGGGP